MIGGALAWTIVSAALRRYDDALRVYGEVLADDPTNQRTHYFRGLVLARMGRGLEARKAYATYLGFREVPPDLRGQAWYRLGALYEHDGDVAHARTAFQQAVATGKNEAAARALEGMDQ